jgi:hypothetical protein
MLMEYSSSLRDPQLAAVMRVAGCNVWQRHQTWMELIIKSISMVQRKDVGDSRAHQMLELLNVSHASRGASARKIQLI